MQYIKVSFDVASQQQSDMLIAMLADAGFDGFEELAGQLYAYIEQPRYHEAELDAITVTLDAEYTAEIVPAQNWNALWESNFQPVVVDDFCTIRADFHDIEVTTPYDILITPKMSFGTGHHSTTQLMMMLMRDVTLKEASVLDFGTGTGVLAILAELLGAGDILAIDNDEWCVENANENVLRNNCSHITVQKGSLDEISFVKNDVILANINRHILLQYMDGLYKRLNIGGVIIMSGLLTSDRDIITEAAESAGFTLIKMQEQMNWIALIFSKV